MNQTPEVLSVILAQHGDMSSSQLAHLIAAHPGITVAVKMGCSPRFLVPANCVDAFVARRIGENPSDYVREVFLPVGTYDGLRTALGMSPQVY